MYVLKNGEKVNDPMYIMPDEWVNDRVVEKIRSKYGINEELKLVRLGAMDSGNAEFVAFNEYVESIRAWGRGEKEMYAKRKSEVKDVLD
ncbi:MAG: hypothetical protein RBS48_04900 [Ignavibacteriaceae bacterium]|jgi:hypothetical protein|nr:hypothetical protein [Ignavibacteriaceae bacterium]